METRNEQTFATKRRARNTTRRTPIGDVMRLFPWNHVNHAWLDMSCFNVSINPAHVMQRSRYHVSMGTLSIFPQCGIKFSFVTQMRSPSSLLRLHGAFMDAILHNAQAKQVQFDYGSRHLSMIETQVFPWKHYKTPSHEASCFHHCMSLSCDVQPRHKSASMETRLSS